MNYTYYITYQCAEGQSSIGWIIFTLDKKIDSGIDIINIVEKIRSHQSIELTTKIIIQNWKLLRIED